MDDQQDFQLPPSLEHARIADLPESAFYLPNFISKDEEQVLLSKVCSATPEPDAPMFSPSQANAPVHGRLLPYQGRDGNSSRTGDCKPGPLS